VELLRLSGVPGHQPYADALSAAWDTIPKQPWLAPFVDQAPAVGKLFLTRELAALNNNTLLALNPGAVTDHERVEQLAAYLLAGTKRPQPSADQQMHPRLVPCAAQLALWRADGRDAARLEHIHKTAMDYLFLIPLITNLAGFAAVAAQRRDYFQQLTRNIDFRKLREAED
jgi:hypothetical protein